MELAGSSGHAILRLVSPSCGEHASLWGCMAEGSAAVGCKGLRLVWEEALAALCQANPRPCAAPSPIAAAAEASGRELKI